METRTARIELSTKVTSDLFSAVASCTSVLGDRLGRQAERHPHPRDVPCCGLGSFGLQVVFPFDSCCILNLHSGMDMDLSGAGGLSKP